MPRETTIAMTRAGVGGLEFADAMLADPGPNELIVELAACGICHTDLIAMNLFSAPAVLGHEGVGVVVETGIGVEKVKIGDRVVMTFGSCGACESCVQGSPAYCWRQAELNTSGRRADGTPSLALKDGAPIHAAFFQQSSFSTFALATERNVVRISDELPVELAAPLGCSVQTGVGAVTNQLRPEPNHALAVFGAGAVGVCAIMAAKMMGLETIIAIDPNEERIALAKQLGAHYGLDAAGENIVDEIKEISGGGAYFSIDAAGRPASFRAAIECLRPRGACGVMTPPSAWGDDVAHPGGASMMFTKLIGLVEGDSNPDEFIPQLAHWILDGSLPVDRIVDAFPFARINDALAAMREGKVVKPVLIF